MRQESICAATAHAAVGQFLTDKDIIDNVQLRKPRWLVVGSECKSSRRER
jgi:hypothetical protein